MLLSPGCGRICQEFPRVSVLNITLASLVQAVRLSIPVIGVQVIIGQLSVTFVPPISPPIITPSQPSPNLPTSIKVDRLISLLSGYSHSTVEFLYSGFSFGFPIHFEGERVSSTSKNLCLLFYIPRLKMIKLGKSLIPVGWPVLFRFRHFIHSAYPP